MYHGDTTSKMRTSLRLVAYESCRVAGCEELGRFVPYLLENYGRGRTVNHGPDQECLMLCAEHKEEDAAVEGGLYTSATADSVLFRRVIQPKWTVQPEWEE